VIRSASRELSSPVDVRLSPEASKSGISTIMTTPISEARRRWIAPLSGLAVLVFTAVGILRTAVSPLPPAAALQPARSAVQTLPLRFEPNLGQTDPAVRFVARGAGYQLLLEPAQAVLVLESPKSDSLAWHSQAKGNHSTRTGVDRSPESAAEPKAVVRMQLAGANASPPLRAESALGGHSNYFLGDDPSQWLRHVPHYGRVWAEGVYPGIDLTYYGSQGRLEYDFLVAPGRDPSLIELTFEGIERLAIDDAGDLVLATSSGELRQQRPIVYQQAAGEKRLIAGDYALRGKRRIGFRLGEYDQSLPLVIDPILTFASYLGGSNFDQMHGVALDAQGNVFVSGNTESADFPAPGPRRPRSGPSDVVVLKLDPQAATVLYSTYLGGSADEFGLHWVAADAAGNAYVAGATGSADFPILQPIQGAFGGAFEDTFVTKLDANGDLVYSTFLGGSGSDFPEGVAVDDTGAVYVAGGTSSTNFPTSNPRQGAFGGGDFDAYLAKINPAGNALVYSTYLGGSDIDLGGDVAVDAQGSAYLTGNTSSANFPTTAGAYLTTGAGGPDAFLTKLNPDGSAILYSTRLGGSGGDFGVSVAVDSDGSAFVGGSTDSADFPVTSVRPPIAEDEVFLTKLTPDGASLVHSTYLGGSRSEFLDQIMVNRFGEAYLIGETTSEDFPALRAVQAAHGGGVDAFLAKLSASGTELIYSTFLGGTGQEGAIGLALDDVGTALLAGFTDSLDFPTQSPLQAVYGGGDSDGFLVRVDEVVNVSAASYLGAELTAGSIASAFSSGMAAATEAANSTPLPTTLAGVSVTVTDNAGVERPSELFVVTPGQINFFIPEETVAGPAIVTVTTADGVKLRQRVPIVAVAPGLFSADASGSGTAAAGVLRIKPDGSQTVEPAAVFNAQQGAFVAAPIDFGPPGDQIYLLLYGTGLRGGSPGTATVGGEEVGVLGPVAQGEFVGLDQSNLGPLPISLAGKGDVDIVFHVAGKTANTVTVRFR
jgi:uncharacterized protein (TIGR03437 family)